MNIKQAKKQIKHAMIAYFTKDEYGNYRIPLERQRPIFLLGAPGIGKTAIIEQIAQELDVAFVSYSMTHHTRQSALGLPKITHKIYNGQEYDISEYTMSEIIASVYETMKKTGKNEGILFLDEINCVSETLAPSMLLFLQYKIFGTHRVPDGWIVVTAGNPPEYNKSVREFDIVTLDRLKKIEVEPDYKAWKEYAINHQIHPSILTYLEIRKNNFYHIESTIDGQHFVTARGWEDLSQMLRLYEEHDLTVNEDLISQYIQDPKIAKDYAAYYDLFHKYQSDYQIEKIISGNISEEIKERVQSARFDERMTLIGLLTDAIIQETSDVLQRKQSLLMIRDLLRNWKAHPDSVTSSIQNEIHHLEQQIISGRNTHILSEHRVTTLYMVQNILKEYLQAYTSDSDFQKLIQIFQNQVGQMEQTATTASAHLEHIFHFFEEVFTSGQEMLILVTELTINQDTSSFISQFGCESYFRHNKDLLFYERNKEIIRKLDELNI